MNRNQLKNCGLPIGEPTIGSDYDRVVCDPITALIVGTVASAGASVYSASESRKDAKKEAARQQALVDKQEAKIEAEKQKQLKEQQERRARAQTSELLTGTETGITGQPAGTLLASGGQ